jgi:hypothetical protein
MTHFGFFDLHGQRVAVRERRQLGLPYVQEALRAAAAVPGAWLQCCCGGGRIRPFELPGFPFPVFDVRRESGSDQHPAGCFAGQQGFFLDRPPATYALGAFAAPSPDGANAAAASMVAGQPRTRFASFTHFCYSLLGRASIRALLAANPGQTYRGVTLRPFSVADLDAAIDGCLRAMSLSRGQPLLPALGAAGLELLWGTTAEEFGQALNAARDQEGDLLLLLHGVKSSTGKGYPERWIRIPRAVAARAGGRRTSFKDLIRPPYFYWLTVAATPAREGDRQVMVATRAVVFPIASLSGIHAVESEFERDALLELLRRGIALLKPASHLALGELGPAFWPFGLAPSGRLPHRVDVIMYYHRRCVLTELAGLDGDAAYLATVDRRLERLKAVAGHDAVRGHKVLRGEFYARMKLKQSVRGL